uniref:Uncharacterized protein n=1 Tax=Dendroctonus ponderosae TaxID=77166 RepID=A0AAR5QIK8_DENPD
MNFQFYEYDKFNAKTADKITNTLTNLSQILLAGKRRKEILQKEFDLDIKDEADGILKDVETASHFCINQNNLIEEKKTQLATDFIDTKHEFSTLVNNSKSQLKLNVEICEKQRNELLHETHRKIEEDLKIQLNSQLSNKLVFIEDHKKRISLIQGETEELRGAIHLFSAFGNKQSVVDFYNQAFLNAAKDEF